MGNVALLNENFYKEYFEISIVAEVKNINNDIIVVENAGNMLNVRMLYTYELNKLQVGDSIEFYIMLKDYSFEQRKGRNVVSLVGYISKDIRHFCEALEISGIGPRISAAIFEGIRVSGMDIDFACKEITSGDGRFFAQFAGIGEKSSVKLCSSVNLNEFRRLGNIVFNNLDKINVIREENNRKTNVVQEKNSSKTVEQIGAIDELNKLIGLKSVKAEIQSIANFAKVQKQRIDMGLPRIATSNHLVFSGNPGTGKTTVARIIAKIYKELGLLSKGHLVETDRSGLVAGYMGQTAIQTKAVIDNAIGGVLFIDEAYTLNGDGNDYGQEAIDTLLKAMEDHRDDLIVIVAGYEDLMMEFVKSNPGLQSRFSKYIRFDDYNGEELFDIFVKLCNSNKFVLESGCDELLRSYFGQISEKHDKNFGNAREIRNYFEKVMVNQAKRISQNDSNTQEDLLTICKDDLGLSNESNETIESVLYELKSLIGLNNVKQEIEGLVNFVNYQKIRKEKGLNVPNLSLHLVFSGNPGTGKTTVARIIAKIYKELGLITNGQVIEVDRSDLVAGYVGQTAIKTQKVIEKAIGNVLFIDEAYTLLGEGNDFGQEAIDTLLKEMEDNRDNLVVIIAGYTEELEKFINSNPGLESRFNRYIDFEDYSAEELLDMFLYMSKKNQYNIDETAKNELLTYFNSIDVAQFGNGRGVRNLFEKIITYQANNIDYSSINDTGDISLLTSNDVRGVLNQ